MPTSPTSAFLDDLFKPETREELEERLHSQSDGHENPNAARSSRRSSSQRPTSVPEDDLLSPMTREEYDAEQSQTTTSSPSSAASPTVWQDPGFRKGLGIGTFVMFLLLVLWLLFSGSPTEEATTPAADANQTQVSDNAPQTPTTSQTPPPKPLVSQSAIPQPAVPQKTIVLLKMDGPPTATLEIDGQVYQNKAELELALAPGFHSLKITQAGFVTSTRNIFVETAVRQVIFLTMAPNPEPVESYPQQETRPAPIYVISTPSGATVLSRGHKTQYTTPDMLPVQISEEGLSVELAGHRVRDSRLVVTEEGLKRYEFDLEPLPAGLEDSFLSKPTTPADYGFEWTKTQEKNLAADVGLFLNRDWNASPQKAVEDGRIQFNVRKRNSKGDSRFDHAYALMLWKHQEIHAAKEALSKAVQEEKTRPNRKVPYYPMRRDLIRLKSVTDEEVEAAEDLLDLMKDTAQTLKHYPSAGRYEAHQNAEFAGRMLGFLEGPKRKQLRNEVNPRIRNSEIENTLSNSELLATYREARDQVRKQYQEELAFVSEQDQARADKQRDLQERGLLFRKRIAGKDQYEVGRNTRSDHNAQTVTPFRIPAVTSYSRDELGNSNYRVGPAALYFPNLLFASSPAVSKSYFYNRTNNLAILTHKEVQEELPHITHRRPQSLTTYLPQQLERKRRVILASLPTPVQ